MGGTLSRFFNLFQSRYIAKAARDAPAGDVSGVAKGGAAPLAAAVADGGPIANGVQTHSGENAGERVVDYAGDYGVLPEYVRSLSMAWLAGRLAPEVAKPVGDDALGRRIIEQLDALAESEFSGANLIPRVPSVMVQLLKRSHEENVTDSDLARLIAKDVVLVAALLNEVNSSFYKTNKQVTDLNQAIMLLGHKRLRLVLARLSFTPVFNDQFGQYTRRVAGQLWEQSQQRALASYILSKTSGNDPFLAFLAGLMQEVGFAVALRVMERIDSQAVLPDGAAFEEALRDRIGTLSTRIVRYWAMPEPVVAAIAGQISEPMTVVLREAGFLSNVALLIRDKVLQVDMEKMSATLDGDGMACLTAILGGRVSLDNVM